MIIKSERYGSAVAWAKSLRAGAAASVIVGFLNGMYRTAKYGLIFLVCVLVSGVTLLFFLYCSVFGCFIADDDTMIRHFEANRGAFEELVQFVEGAPFYGHVSLLFPDSTDAKPLSKDNADQLRNLLRAAGVESISRSESKIGFKLLFERVGYYDGSEVKSYRYIAAPFPSWSGGYPSWRGLYIVSDTDDDSQYPPDYLEYGAVLHRKIEGWWYIEYHIS